jgi:hypothetical protein
VGAIFVNFTADVGFPAKTYKTLTVTAAACLPTSHVGITWQTTPNTAMNDMEMDSLTFRVIPGTGNFQLIITPERNESIGGVFLLRHQITN